MLVAIADMPGSSLFQASRNLMVYPGDHPSYLRRRSLLSSPVNLQPVCPWLHNTRVVDCFHNGFRRSSCRPLCFSSVPSTAGNDYAYENRKQAAIEAVSDILKENGVSMEESMEIAVKSPKYVEMLMDSVRDLDELFPSASSSISSYKKKVFEMGKQKGDKGLVPLLEGMVGLPLPSAMHIARYLSVHTPPNLLYKVKYMKEMLFSDVEGKVSIAKSARLMMMHLSVPVDDDLQHTLSFLEKIQARRGGLGLLGTGDGSFRYLIESFPRLLLLSIDSNMKLVVDFLEYIGVPKDCIRNILLLYPPILFYDIEKEIIPRWQVFKAYGEDVEFSKMLLKYPWMFSSSIQKNYEEILAFLYAEKVAEVSVHHAVKSWPLILGCSVGKLKLMIDQFHRIGVTEKMMHKIIATSPQLLTQTPQEFCQQVVSYLKGLGLEEQTVRRILGRCPEIFMSNIDKTLKKKVKFLSELGVSEKHLPRVIRKYPELFVCDVNNSLLPRMMYLLKIGLSKREVASMVGRFSPLLGYSIEEVLRPKYEFLVNTMQMPLKEVVEYPRYFSYSLEKKIKPRFRVIKGRNCECSLKDMLGKNDEEFAADYMSDLRLTVVPPP